MSMMIARESHEKVYDALVKTIEAENLTKVFELPKARRVELHRGINLFTYGDEIIVHLVDIDPVVVVNIQSKLKKGNPQLMVWRNLYLKQELKFLKTMMGFIGEDRCHILQ
jgi:hypothetical protein